MSLGKVATEDEVNQKIEDYDPEDYVSPSGIGAVATSDDFVTNINGSSGSISDGDIFENGVQVPQYQSEDDVPNLPQGTIVYIEEEQQHFFENGN